MHWHRPLGNGQVVTIMRTTVSTQPQIIIVVCCITLRRSAYDCDLLRWARSLSVSFLRSLRLLGFMIEP